jgi:sulfatase maturation enzyme AslB (radical SAM superfamily)
MGTNLHFKDNPLSVQDYSLLYTRHPRNINFLQRQKFSIHPNLPLVFKNVKSFSPLTFLPHLEGVDFKNFINYSSYPKTTEEVTKAIYDFEKKPKNDFFIYNFYDLIFNYIFQKNTQ